MDSPDAINPDRWRGTNRLGNIMTDVREKLLKDLQFHEVTYFSIDQKQMISSLLHNFKMDLGSRRSPERDCAQRYECIHGTPIGSQFWSVNKDLTERSNGRMCLQIVSTGGGFGGTPQQGFKRRFSDMDHRDAKRQR